MKTGARARHAYEVNRARIASVWAQAQTAVPGDAADLFLRSSGAAPFGPGATWPAALRMHPALEYWHVGADGQARCLGRFAALLALFVVDVFPSGLRAAPVPHAVALQRIYLLPDGALAPVPAPYKLTGKAGPALGAVARLAPQASSADVVGIAVGIATALRLARATRIPVWAVPDAAALAHARWPRSARSVHVFVDAREAQQWQPAAALARKASACGLQVFPMVANLADAGQAPRPSTIQL